MEPSLSPTTVSVPSIQHAAGQTDRCTAVLFARLVWWVSAAAREAGLMVPAFRDSPQSSARHLRRRPGQLPVVVVAVGGRPVSDVLADVVAGFLAVNRDASPVAVESFIATAHGTLPSRPGPSIGLAA
jgi:hypothetical protein